MKLILITLMALLSYYPVSSNKKNDDIEKMKREIINADLAMSDLAAKEGFIIALSKNAAEDFVKFSDGSYPVIGKDAYDKKYEGKTGPKTLTWKPEKADVAESGDLGYTWGYWKYELPDTTAYGNYFTVWKKQSDGSWKMELDGGNSTPGPKQ